MITGIVGADEGRIRLRVVGPSGQEREISAVVDTGYTGSLTLPGADIAALGLQYLTVERGTLADGQVCLLDVYVAYVEWDDQVQPTPVAKVDGDPLVGMRLLRGYEPKMQVRARGAITITRLP